MEESGGPSGVGKGTLISKTFEKYPGKFSFSVSYTTRPPRGTEQNGFEYHFVDREAFQKIIDEDGFIEYCNVHEKMYGTAIKELDRIKGDNKIPVLDIDVQGAQKVHNKQIESVFLFIFPADPNDMDKVKEILEKRLRGRGTDSEEQIQTRLKNAVTEIESFQNASFFTHTLINDDLETSTAKLFEILESEYSHELLE